jgi:hypothetical protein
VLLEGVAAAMADLNTASPAAFLQAAHKVHSSNCEIRDMPLSLWHSDDPQLWESFRASYPAAVLAASKSKPAKKNLVELDHWWRIDLPRAIKLRKPSYITQSELSHVMKWKLTRGKMRPLQKLVDSNKDGDVQLLSTEAFKIVSEQRSYWSGLFELNLTCSKGSQGP